MHATSPAIYLLTPAVPMFLWLLHYQLPASAVTAILRQATVRNTQRAWRSCRCVCKWCPYITAALMQGAGGGRGAVRPGRGGISHCDHLENWHFQKVNWVISIFSTKYLN